MKHEDGFKGRIVSVNIYLALDGASLQVEENGVAQAAVKAAAQSCGGLFQDDPPVQHPRVRILFPPPFFLPIG